MKNKLLKSTGFALLSLYALSAIFTGCGGGSSNVDNQIEDSISVNTSDEFNKAKQVIYGVPSPIETAMLMKRAGAHFNADYLNPVANVAKYTTTEAMALNLGVYGTDMSFASIFDKSQLTVKYLSTTKKLADDLGILNAIDKSIMERMEKNVNNRDSVMEIISETFMNSNSFLKENDRSEIAAIILCGGWIEGLYIGSMVAKNTASNKELIDRIADQRLSLYTLLSLLDEYKDDPNVKMLLPHMEKLKAIFDKIQTSASKLEVEEKDGKSIISSKTEVKVSPDIFNEICTAAADIRTNIIK